MNASVSLQGKYVTAVSPEGAEGKIKIADLLNRSSPAAALVEQLVNPDGCRKIIARGRYAILVHETPPRVRTFKWIARGSDVPYGPEANYTDVSIALPYVVVMAVFECDTSGGVKLTNANECFFSNEPLVSMDQP
ncbi:MAG: hypothetical protein QF805_15485, partial [Pirellulaceae bacterium]|nr:hypothetical protein [Pirellulaceae bacterium]